MEKQTRQSADIPKWSALLVEAVNKPGLIMKAYSAFHSYSLGNQLLALVQCQMRGLQPGPINTFPKWQDFGRHVKRGERALVLCMPITCKRRNEETVSDDESNGEGTFTSFVYKARWFVLSQTEGRDLDPQVTSEWYPKRALAALGIDLIPFDSTEWQAEQAETQIRQLVYEGKYSIVVNAPRLTDFIDETFLPWSKANKSSWRNDVSRAKVIVDFMGQKRLNEITPEMIEKFKLNRYDSITCRGRRRSKASVNHELELLSKIFSLAVKYKKVSTNPCRDVQRFKLDNIRNRYFSSDEEERLLAQCTRPRAHIRPIVVLGIGTGMRLGEILRLTKQQLDFERNVVIMHTKTRHDRVIPMNSEVREAVLEVYSKCGDEECIFVNPTTGSRVTEIKRSFTTALRLAGIKGATFHTTRHTFGTRLGDAGYNAFEIAELMGHSDIKTSQRYVHPTDARKRAAVESAKRNVENSPHNSPTKHEQRSSLIAVSG